MRKLVTIQTMLLVALYQLLSASVFAQAPIPAPPDSIEVNLTGGAAGGNFALPAKIVAKSFTGPTTRFNGSNGKPERGSPLYSSQVEPGATFYAVSGGAQAFPSPLRANNPFPNRLGGSSFIAIKQDEEGFKKIWVNLSTGAWRTNATSGTTFDWEYQFRYYLDTKTGEEKASYGTVANANGYAGQEVEFTVDIYFKSVLVINPNPSLIDEKGILKNDLDAIAALKPPFKVKGVSTDGVTKLLLVLETNKKEDVRFTLPDLEDGSFGTLNQPDQRKKELTLPSERAVVDGKEKWLAVAVYTAPDSYGEGHKLKGGRKVPVFITKPANGEKYELSLRLYTPPVILVHGMWSNPKAWEGDEDRRFRNYLNFNGFEIPENQVADYSFNNYSTFDPMNAGLPVRAVEVATLQALRNYGELDIACTQVDVVAHSLGGLMTRSFAQQTYYTKASNYRKGYVHKLITLGTPHLGTPLGPLLYEAKPNILLLNVQPSQGSFFEGLTYNAITQWAKQPIGTCHRDFNPEESNAYANLEETKVKSHAITGTYGVSGLDLVGVIGGLLQILTDRLDLVIGDPMSTHQKVFGNKPNDVIVPLGSQEGKLGAEAVTPFSNTIHSGPSVLSDTETSSIAIQKRVRDLLISNDPDLFAPSFPKPGIRPKKSTMNPDSEGILADGKRLRGGQANSKRTGTGKERVSIVSPGRGEAFDHKAGNKITLKYAPVGGSKPLATLFLIEGVGMVSVPATAPFEATFEITKDMPLGKVNIALLSRDSSGLAMADTSHIFIQASSPITRLSVTPKEILLDSLLRQAPLSLSGKYLDGADSVTVYLNRAGATFRALKGSEIVKVEGAGLVTAVKAGTDLVEVKYGDQTLTVPVTVSPDFALSVLKGDSITFPPIGDREVSDPSFGLTASAASDLPVMFTLVSGPATLHGDILTLTGLGKVTIKAFSEGDIYHRKAQEATQTFCVSPTVPTVTPAVSYCVGETAQPLSATGSNLKWYSASTGGAALAQAPTPATVSAGVTDYYVSQTENGCESLRAKVTVTIKALPAVTLIPFANTVCSTNANFGLSEGSPAGGTYSGPGVSNGIFNATLAGVGSHSITYTYWVNGCMETASQEITVSTCTGIAESELSKSLSLYPNPTGESLHVTFTIPKKTAVELTLFDSKGKEVLRERFSKVSGEFNQRLDLKGKATGIYLLRLTTDEGGIVRRVVKQ
ncbi:T9SS type A sorting domain-containing protein [Rufibacter latericius]|nr:T9SS type A sorting domain-containing protein [Rufibacter latericius]